MSETVILNGSHRAVFMSLPVVVVHRNRVWVLAETARNGLRLDSACDEKVLTLSNLNGDNPVQ